MNARATGQGSIAKAGLMGGAIAAVLHATPFLSSLNACCCALVVAAGLFAAWVLQSDSGRMAGTGRCGAAGALAGCIGGLAGVPLAAVVARLAFGIGALEERVAQTMLEMRTMIEGMGGAPGADHIAESCIRATVGLEFNAWTIVAMLVTSAMFSFFGLLGGLLGGVLLRPVAASASGRVPPPPGRGLVPPPPPPPPVSAAPATPVESQDAVPAPAPAADVNANAEGDSAVAGDREDLGGDEGPLEPDELPTLPPPEDPERPAG